MDLWARGLRCTSIRSAAQVRSDPTAFIFWYLTALPLSRAVASAILSLLAFMDGLGARVLRFKLWGSELELEQPRPRVPIKGMHEGVLYGLCRD